MKDTEDQFNETTKPPSTSCELPTREFWATPRASKRGFPSYSMYDVSPQRFLVIWLPAVEKRRSGEAEVAGTANTRRASRPRKGHTFLSPHNFHSIRGSSVLGRGTVRNFHNPISLSAISSAVTSKLVMVVHLASHDVSSRGPPAPGATPTTETRSSLMRSMSMLRRTFQPSGS